MEPSRIRINQALAVRGDRAGAHGIFRGIDRKWPLFDFRQARLLGWRREKDENPDNSANHKRRKRSFHHGRKFLGSTCFFRLFKSQQSFAASE
jgi:hypothetical protein